MCVRLSTASLQIQQKPFTAFYNEIKIHIEQNQVEHIIGSALQNSSSFSCGPSETLIAHPRPHLLIIGEMIQTITQIN